MSKGLYPWWTPANSNVGTRTKICFGLIMSASRYILPSLAICNSDQTDTLRYPLVFANDLRDVKERIFLRKYISNLFFANHAYCSSLVSGLLLLLLIEFSPNSFITSTIST